MNSWVPNGQNTSNWRRIDVNITSMRRKLSIDEILRRFDKLFRYNFIKWKYDVISMCFVWRDVDGRKFDAI